MNVCEKNCEVNEYPEIIAGCVNGASKGNHETIKNPAGTLGASKKNENRT